MLFLDQVSPRLISAGMFFILLVAPTQAKDNPHIAVNAEMTSAATSFLESLSPELRENAEFQFDGEQRTDWHFIPKDRVGVSFKEMNLEQRRAARLLMRSVLSEKGYLKSTAIMSLEQVLRLIEASRENVDEIRDPEKYWFAVFGDPAGGKPWGWRVEGHHLSLNFTSVDGKVASVTPLFFGTNPAEVRIGPRIGLRVLGDEEDQARDLMAAFTDSQRNQATISETTPADVLTVPGKPIDIGQPAGIAAGDMDEIQQVLLKRMISSLANHLRPALAKKQLRAALSGDFDKIYFAWAGSLDREENHYFRIHSPNFILEYDNAQGNHAHLVWHSSSNDFAARVLHRHYKESPHHKVSKRSASQKVNKVPDSDNQWPMSGGPDGSWKVTTSENVPTKWSVRNNENIKWKQSLPEGGQSGIAVWGDKLFLTINPPMERAPAEDQGAVGTDIVLLCLNANDGQTLWSRPVKGLMPSGYHYGFSDSTTPCPITDGQHVWAINSSGGMACFTMDGDSVWSRTWMPTGGRPFNKQYDSMLYDDLILNVEPPAEGDDSRIKDWNYLHAFDKASGKRLWVTEDALTHYNAPVLGTTANGNPAVLIGRGGPHGVPERPVGLSLISLEPGKAGTALWQWKPEEDNNLSGWGALSTQHWDKQKAGWFYQSEHHLTIDTKTGKLLDRQPLNPVDQYTYDEAQQSYVLNKSVSIKKLEGQRHCNMLHGDDLFYMVRDKPFLARHNVATGKNEHLEVPREIADDGSYIWKAGQKNDGLNSKGQRQSGDKRTLGGGFQKCFLGSPTMINEFLFFTNAIGMVYVVDTSAAKFDKSALISVNDLGKRGETWTVNSLSYANGRIYHRTLKEIICIGK